MNYLKNFILLFLIIIGVVQNLSCGFKSIEKDNFDWQLTFEDNFDIFDRSIWLTHHINGQRTIWSNKEREWYVDENAEAENGILKLTANKQSIYGKDTYSEKLFDYTSGMICSSNSILQAYGKWEMKVRFPFKKGFWPAFFLVPVQRPTLPEIDVFEYFGINEHKISCSHMWGLDYADYSDEIVKNWSEPFFFAKTKEIEGDYSNVWMIWSFEWFPNKIVWKLNGNVVNESNEGIPTAPMYMIANVAVKDRPESNILVDDSGSPYIMEIDYVRVYRMIPKKN